MAIRVQTTVGDRIEASLARLLGPNTARSALRTFSKRTLGVEPEVLAESDVPRLLAALRPALRTLLGNDAAQAAIDEIERGFR
jgi:hypothetical protein